MEIQYISTLPVERWREYKQLRINALTTDKDAFSATLEEQLQDSDEGWQNRLQDNLDGKRLILFAESEGNLVGMVAVYLHQKNNFRHNSSIVSFYVHPDHRGRGIGRGLLSNAIEWCKAQTGRTNVLSEVFGSQAASVELHKQLGFEVVGVVKDFVQIGNKYFDSIMMQKVLDNEK